MPVAACSHRAGVPAFLPTHACLQRAWYAASAEDSAPPHCFGENMKTKYTGIAVLLLLSVYLTACVMEGQTPLPTNKGKGDIVVKVSEEGDGKVLSITASLSLIYGQFIEPEGTVIRGLAGEDIGEIKDGSFKISLPAEEIGLFAVGSKDEDDVFIHEAMLMLATYSKEKQAVYIIVPKDDTSWGFVEITPENISDFIDSPDDDSLLDDMDIKSLDELPSTANWYCMPSGE